MYDTSDGTLDTDRYNYRQNQLAEWKEIVCADTYKLDYADVETWRTYSCFDKDWNMVIFHDTTPIAIDLSDEEYRRYTLLLDPLNQKKQWSNKQKFDSFRRLFNNKAAGLSMDKKYGFKFVDRSHHADRITLQVSGNRDGKVIPLVKGHTYECLRYPEFRYYGTPIWDTTLRKTSLPQSGCTCKSGKHNFIRWYYFERQEYHTCSHCNEFWRFHPDIGFEKLYHSPQYTMQKIKGCNFKEKFFLSMPNAMIAYNPAIRNYMFQIKGHQGDWYWTGIGSNIDNLIPWYPDTQEDLERRLLKFKEVAEDPLTGNWDKRTTVERYNELHKKIERIHGSCTLPKLSL